MWVEMLKPDGKRLLLNLDLTFCFDEGEDGVVRAVSITGTGAPVGADLDTIKTEITEAEE